jgi:hypothetical protein
MIFRRLALPTPRMVLVQVNCFLSPVLETRATVCIESAGFTTELVSYD